MSQSAGAASLLAAAMPERLLERFARQRLSAGFLVSTQRGQPDRILLLREGIIARPSRRQLLILRPEVFASWQEGEAEQAA